MTITDSDPRGFTSATASPRRPQQLLLAAVLVALAAAVFRQLLGLPELLLDTGAFLTAAFAKGLVLGYGLAVAIVLVVALVLGERARLWFITAVVSVAAALVLATLVASGNLWGFCAAALTLLAMWQVGSVAVRFVSANRNGYGWLFSGLVGSLLVASWVFFMGRLGAITWLTVGVPVILAGLWPVGFGLYSRTERHKALQNTRDYFLSCSRNRVKTTALLLLSLSIALAAVWAAAPEIMYDALYGKAYLPAEWARTGEITWSALHAPLNLVGSSQFLAVPGHELGFGSVGRYLQFLSLIVLGAAVWGFSRSSTLGPVAAGVVVSTPLVVWEASTAYDDLLIVLAALALADFVSWPDAHRNGRDSLRIGLTCGIGLAAVCAMKLHVAPLAVALVLGWWLSVGRRSPVALLGIIGAAAVCLAPVLVSRWIDVGNPVFPAFNNLFRAEGWPLVNEQFNFPFMTDVGSFGPVTVFSRALSDPAALGEALPVGAVSVLPLLVPVVLAAGFSGTLRSSQHLRRVFPLWFGVLLATIVWYLNIRYLRYLLPVAVISVIVLVIIVRVPAAFEKPDGSRALSAGLACVCILFFPSTIAMFWNVPGRDLPVEAVFGSRSEADYLRASMPEYDAVIAFDRLAPPRALAISDAHQRIWLTRGRDLSPPWEISKRALAAEGEDEGVARLAKRTVFPVRFPNRSRRLLQQLGVSWVIEYREGPIATDPGLQAVIKKFGRLRFRDSRVSVYSLSSAGISR